MKNLMLAAALVILGTAAMAQTTAPVTDKSNNVSTVARQTESAKGKGEIVSAEARRQKADQVAKTEKRAELKAANAAPRSAEAKAIAETKKAAADTRARSGKARPAYAGQSAATAKPMHLVKPVKPARAVKGK